MPVLLHCIESATLGSLGVECFQPPLAVSGELHITPSCFTSASPVKVSSRTCHTLIQTPNFICTLFNAAHSPQHVEDIPWFPIVNDLIRDALAGWVLKDQTSSHLTLWLHTDMCHADKASLPPCKVVVG